jgi:hypothetical protein
LVELLLFKHRGFGWKIGGRLAGLVASLGIRLTVDSLNRQVRPDAVQIVISTAANTDTAQLLVTALLSNAENCPIHGSRPYTNLDSNHLQPALSGVLFRDLAQ